MTDAALYSGSIMHRRLSPRTHRFRYRAFWILLDVDRLADVSRVVKLFSYNRPNLFSLRDRDHGDGSDTPIREQIRRKLAENGIRSQAEKIELLFLPRILGFLFNPLSVYFCYRADGGLAATVYEVHNTFRGRHSYVIAAKGETGAAHQSCNKAFFVSPFLDMAMRYEFTLRLPGKRIAVGIRALQGGRPVMLACLSAARKPLTDAALLKSFFAIPLLTFKVIAAIHWEALRLWLKGVRLKIGKYASARPAGALPLEGPN
jgi:DUF1365 family protein